MPARVWIVSTFSGQSTYQVGATACAVLHTPEPWVCAGLISPKWVGAPWVAVATLDLILTRALPGRVWFASGLTQVAAMLPWGCIGSWPTCLSQVSLVSW